jgi:ABC-type polysaccharide/polyol phosphate export permease
MSLTPDEAVKLAAEYHLIPINRRVSLSTYVRDAWKLRHFTRQFAIGRVIVATVQSNLGLIWDVLNPVLLSITYYLAFGLLLGTHSDSPHFIVFLTAGVFAWTLFSQTFTSTAQSLAKDENLAEGMRLPRILLPIAAGMQEGIRAIPAMLLLFPIAWLGGVTPNVTWLFVPFIFFATMMLGISVGMLASRLIARFRDLMNIIPLGIRVMMFSSGVFYDVEKRFAKAPETVRVIAENNPAALMLNFVRGALMPEKHPTHYQLIWVISLTIVCLLIGLLAYWRGDTHDE